MEDTLRKKFQISSYDVDPKGNARLTSIANYLQETAYKHAASLNLGYSHLAKEGRAWVLSRLKIKIHAYPKWDDIIEVETWPRGLEKLFALRDFRIRSATGELLCEASTCWLMIDMNNHRPVRIDQSFIPIETRTDAVFKETPGKIPFPELTIKCATRKAVYSDLDVVGHVNNVKFIEWCLDGMDVAELTDKGVSDFEINYLGEAKLENSMELFCTPPDEVQGDILISGRFRKGGAECIRALVRFFNI